MFTCVFVCIRKQDEGNIYVYMCVCVYKKTRYRGECTCVPCVGEQGSSCSYYRHIMPMFPTQCTITLPLGYKRRKYFLFGIHFLN